MSAARFEEIYRQKNQMMGGVSVGAGPSQFALRLLKMSKEELSDVAESLDLPKSGTKGELVGRILAYHNAGVNIAPGAMKGKMLPRSSIGYGPKLARGVEAMDFEVVKTSGQPKRRIALGAVKVKGSKVKPMKYTVTKAKKEAKPRQRKVIKRAVTLVPGSMVQPMTYKIVKPKKVVRKTAVKKVAVRKVAGKGPCKAYKPGPKCKVNKNGACPSKLQIAAAKVNPWLRFMAKFRKETKLKGADALAQGSAIYKQMKASGKLANYIRLAPQGLRVCSKK